LLPIVFCLIPVVTPVAQAVGQPDLAELSQSPATSNSAAAPPSAAVRFNALNSRVRDGDISKEAARNDLKLLIAELRSEYYRKGGADYRKDTWVFPLAGHGVRAMGGGRNKGYVAPGYDYFSGNRHGGHPSFDIFITDRNRDSLEDRSGKPVRVLSLTGGIVVALEREWQPGSALRGGKYLWIYDPANDLLVYYAHNSELFVELGDVVNPGDQLAIVGRSGYNAMKRRSPSHLHLTVLHLRDGVPLPLNVQRELVRAAAGGEPKKR
jgi:murein DD-endopeptidase MepM/ murein hydrolase activator NlpD